MNRPFACFRVEEPYRDALEWSTVTDRAEAIQMAESVK
jgi:hypothetical protein